MKNYYDSQADKDFEISEKREKISGSRPRLQEGEQKDLFQ